MGNRLQETYPTKLSANTLYNTILIMINIIVAITLVSCLPSDSVQSVSIAENDE